MENNKVPSYHLRSSFLSSTQPPPSHGDDVTKVFGDRHDLLHDRLPDCHFTCVACHIIMLHHGI